jgi:hypothetical protein
MKKALVSAFLLVLGSVVLGATVLQEPLAWAAAPIASVFITNDESRPVPVREQNRDADGNIKVHEQGTADVNVTNGSLPVAPLPPVRGGGFARGFSCPSAFTEPEPIAASALQIAWLGSGVATVDLHLGDSLVARFIGPAVSGDTSSLVVPLTRPVVFTRIVCAGTGSFIVSTVGNEPS